MAVRVWISPEASPYADRAVKALTDAGLDVAPTSEPNGSEVRVMLGTEAERAELPGPGDRARRFALASAHAAEWEDAGEAIAVVALPEPRDGLVGADGPTSLADLRPSDRVAVLGRLAAEALGVHRPDVDAVVFEAPDEARAALGREEVRAWIAPVRTLRAFGLGDDIGEVLEPTSWPTGPGRGALLVDARGAAEPVRSAVASLNDAGARAATRVEYRVRFLLGVSPDAALGVLARPHGPLLRVRALVPAAEGRRLVRAEVSAPLGDPEEAARRTASQLRARGALSLWGEGEGR